MDFKRALLEASARTALLMVNTKIDTSAPFTIASVSDIRTYVLEYDASPQVVSALHARGAEVRIAEPPERMTPASPDLR